MGREPQAGTRETPGNNNSGKTQNVDVKTSAQEQTGEHMAASKKTAVVKEKYTKSQILADLAEKSGVSKKEVGTVLEGLTQIIESHVSKKGPGEFTLPGLLKITTVHKPAQKARKGINPFTKEEVTFKAKPARTVVKIRPLKKLKEFAE